MSRSVLALALLVASAASAFAQPGPCAGYTFVNGWDETVAATPLGGGTGPEDIAYNPVTNTLFVTHDVPNVTPDILLEYDLNGNLLSSSVNVFGIGGLCAMPNSQNLLATAGNQIIEIDPMGNNVPGGINVTVSGYGNIQDLEFDAQGQLWIHNGNNGDFSIVNTMTGVATTQFILMTPNVTGSQAMTFNPAGNILVAAAFFMNGGLSNGAFLEVTPAGTIVCQNASGTSPQLQQNGDPCLGGANFTIVNGMTWIAPLNELAISNFFLVNGSNIARFAPASTAYLAKIGTDALRADNLPFRLTASGDAVIGTTGFTLTLQNIYPGDTVIWGISAARDCNNLSFGTGNLYIDINPPNLLLLTFIPANASTLAIPIDLTGLGPAAAGVDLFTQFAGTDLGSPMLSPLLSSALRVHFELQ